jgi:pilus assembly protein CpaF
MSASRGWDASLRVAFGPLMELIDDEGITNIDVHGFDEVWATGEGWRGHRHFPEVRWESFEHLRGACVRVSRVVNRPIGEDRPILNARLPGGHRINIALPPVCERISLCLRKFPATPMTFDKLEEKGSMDGVLRAICSVLVRARQTIVVAGGCGAGKTSLLNALSTAIPPSVKVVTLEDTRELRMQQPVWTAMETMEPFEQGVEPVTMRDLVKNVFRQNPGRIVVGEVREEDCFFMLDTFASGHPGGMATVHANDAEDALYRLQLLAQRAAASGHSAQVAAGMVGRAVDIVIFQEYFEKENVRRVAEVVEVERPGVVWLEGGRFEYKTRKLVSWDVDEGRWIYPEEPSQSLLNALRRAGCDWPVRGNGSEQEVAA